MGKNEIKIRVWDKEKKRMIYKNIQSLIFAHHGLVVEYHIPPMQSHLKVYDGIIMLSSGLFDEDGKEIYRGDICSNEVAKWEIIFHTGCFCGKRIGGSDGTQNTHLALRAIRGLRIIGNIYETPELLKTDI